MAFENNGGQTGTTQPNAASGASAGQTPAATGQAGQAQTFDQSYVNRLREQVDGGRKYYEAGAKYGLKSDADFQRWGPVIETMTKRGLDPQSFTAAFSDAREENPGDGKAQVKDIEAMLGERLSKFEKDLVMKQAEKEHEAALASEFEQLDKISFGEGVPKSYEDILRKAAKFDWIESRQEYGEDHPLKGRRGPAGGEFFTKTPKSYAEQLQLMKAEKWADIGKQARQTPASGGVSTGTGKPAKESDRDENGLPSRDRMIAKAQALKASRGG